MDSKKLSRLHNRIEHAQFFAENALAAAKFQTGDTKISTINQAEMLLNRRDKLQARLQRISKKMHEMETRRAQRNERLS